MKKTQANQINGGDVTFLGHYRSMGLESERGASFRKWSHAARRGKLHEKKKGGSKDFCTAV